MGPNDSLNHSDFPTASLPLAASAAPGSHSASDSIALVVSGLVMIISASFLRRLSS